MATVTRKRSRTTVILLTVLAIILAVTVLALIFYGSAHTGPTELG